MPDNARDEFGLLQDSSLKVASLYLNWFSWAQGLHLLVLGALFAKGVPDSFLVTGVGSIMVLGAAVAIGAGIQQTMYYRRILKRASELNPFDGNYEQIHLLFARPIFMYVCWAIPALFVLILLGWIVLIRKYGSSFSSLIWS